MNPYSAERAGRRVKTSAGLRCMENGPGGTVKNPGKRREGGRMAVREIQEVTVQGSVEVEGHYEEVHEVRQDEGGCKFEMYQKTSGLKVG